ncbi:TetR/AcrR family transcriptional regulator [Georgenia halophila]
MATPDRVREVRRRLLDAAVELISERGWTAVSTRIVAERAGVAPGLVHYHFASVQALLSQAATAAMRETTRSLGPTLARARTPQEAVNLLARSFGSSTGTDPMSVLFVETYLAATRDPELATAVAETIAAFRSQLAAWLAEQGVPDPAATAAVLGAAIDGLVLQRGMDPELDAAAAAPVLTRLVPHAGESLEDAS